MQIFCCERAIALHYELVKQTVVKGFSSFVLFSIL